MAVMWNIIINNKWKSNENDIEIEKRYSFSNVMK